MKKIAALITVVVLSAMIGAAVFAQDTPTLDGTLASRFGSVGLFAGFAPDPYIVTVSGGVEPDSPIVDVTSLGLGETCLGFSAPAPTYGITYTAEEGRGLRFFFTGDGDGQLIVGAPDGTFVCNDDTPIADAYNPLNPSVDFDAPLSGEYTIWITSYDGALIPGYLFITGLGANSPARITSDLIPEVLLPIPD